MIASARRTPSACKLASTAVAALVAASIAVALPAPAAARPSKSSALPAFSSCSSLLSYARRNARRTGGRTGVPMRAGAVVPQVLGGPVGVPVPAATAPAPARSETAAPSFSQTNVQEAGVDEPDIVKTDGRHVFAIVASSLRALDVSGEAPSLVGSLALGSGSGAYELFIRGDRALVIGTSYGGAYGLAAPISVGSARVVISEIDIANPAAMVVRRSMTVDGALVDARLTGGTARVVVGSSPDFVRPAAIARTAVRAWVPRTLLRSRLSGRTFRRPVVACDEVRHPRDFSGLDLLTVLTIDLDKGLFNVDRDAIMAGAQTVYASTTGLYVASQRYVRSLESGRVLPERQRTEIHRFDTSKADETSYASTGEVTGFILNRYSMSEHDGALRVASTEEPQWFDGVQTGDGESFVTVLAQRGSRLAQLGRVGGLGRGERIYAVRFAGDKGYVVTFRRLDPLYTLDLSDKAAPRVLGTLKIRGFSAYLHPISDDLLLGVGQDASEEGRTLGTQLSLFDVSDLREPVRRAVASLGGNSSSDAEFDPHAFLFWRPSALAVVPLRSFGPDGSSFAGAVGFRVDATALSEAGRVTHPRIDGDVDPPIGRSLVIGERLFTLSYAGLAVNRLDTLAPVAFEAFPRPARAQGGVVEGGSVP